MKMEDLTRKSVEQLETHVRTIVENVRSSDVIMGRIAKYETGLADLEALETALAEFAGLSRTYRRLDAERDGVSATFASAEPAFRRGPFQQAVLHAQYVFEKDGKAWKAVGLHTDLDHVSSHYSDWVVLARPFIDALTSHRDYREIMIGRAYTEDDFDALVEGFTNVTSLHDRREQLASQRQEVRRNRDAARRTLVKALRTLQELGLAALHDRIQLLEQMGVQVPSDAKGSDEIGADL